VGIDRSRLHLQMNAPPPPPNAGNARLKVLILNPHLGEVPAGRWGQISLSARDCPRRKMGFMMRRGRKITQKVYQLDTLLIDNQNRCSRIMSHRSAGVTMHILESIASFFFGNRRSSMRGREPSLPLPSPTATSPRASIGTRYIATATTISATPSYKRPCSHGA